MDRADLDRLSAVDASFLLQEGPAHHMHIGSVALFEGPPPFFEDLREHVRSRLHLVPRYRQRLAGPPAGLGRWRWVDDASFNLDFHLRHTALAAPGDEDRLRALAGRVFAQRLDRGKPLWELWAVEGLADGRWALLSKTHHAVVDGVGGVDLLSVLLDPAAEPQQGEPPPPWVPRPVPTPAQLTAEALQAAVGGLTEGPRRALAATTDVRGTVGGVVATARRVVDRAPRSPLNVPIGPHRRVAFATVELEALRGVKTAVGGTVNDVVLTMVALALRRLYEHRGLRTHGVVLRALVPVSTRHGRIAQLVCPLPLDEPDPVVALRQVSASMAGIKESRQALGAEILAGVQEFAPPTVLAQASRLAPLGRQVNLPVTNVPGPQFPLYVLGRRLEHAYPLGFLAGDRALAITALSYDGHMDVGLLADLDALQDLDVVARGLREALGELLAAASASA
jgi:diacylglycerol O-acyltransferase / wax synthase